MLELLLGHNTIAVNVVFLEELFELLLPPPLEAVHKPRVLGSHSYFYLALRHLVFELFNHNL